MSTTNSNFENLSNVLQVMSFLMLVQDTNNSDLLAYLRHQDKDLLETIINQNKTIIEQNNKLIHLIDKKKGET